MLKIAGARLNLPQGLAPLARQSSEQYLKTQGEIDKLKAEIKQLKNQKEENGACGVSRGGGLSDMLAVSFQQSVNEKKEEIINEKFGLDESGNN